MGRRRARNRGTSDEGPLAFVAGTLTPPFRRSVITVEPGTTRWYEEREWRDSLVVVHRGEIELECVRGGRRRFTEGDILWLGGLDLRAVHNHGAKPAVLVAVSRRR